MSIDPSHEYLLTQLIRRNAHDMTSGFIPSTFDPDPLNRHYDDRRAWLAWRDPVKPADGARPRITRAFVRIRAWLARGEAAQPARP